MQLQYVLSQFSELVPVDYSPASLGNAGGFSGSAFWKIDAGATAFCLKRWPPRFDDAARLRWVSRVLKFVQANGCPQVTVPCRTDNGDYFVSEAGYLWELTPWANGSANYLEQPSPGRLQSAVQTTARLHQATSRFQTDCARSQNVISILGSLDRISSTLDQIGAVFRNDNAFLSPADWTVFAQFAPRLSDGVTRLLKPFEKIDLPLQPVVRDLRIEHFFFVGDEVRAIVDFDAMRIDSVACDLARLLGTSVGDDRNKISEAMTVYTAIRPLTPYEQGLLTPLIQAGVLLGIANWLTWIFVDKRKFDDSDQVRSRLNRLMAIFRACAVNGGCS